MLANSNITSFEHLIRVRSWVVSDLLAYLRQLEEELADNRLLARFGRRLDDLRVPLRALPYEPIRDLEANRARSKRQGAPSDDDDVSVQPVPEQQPVTPEPEPEQQPVTPELLDQLASELEMMVLLGDPGSGKSEWLKYQVRQAAGRAREQLEHFTIRLRDVCFPVYLHLRDMASVLSGEEEKLRAWLEQNGYHHIGGLSDAERAATAILQVLVQRHHLSPRLVPWLWARLNPQDPSSQAPLLLCLDAWDEVPTGETLRVLTRALQAFAARTQAKIFLTSRLIGYSQRPLPATAEGTRREVQLCPFEPEETEAFVLRFFADDEALGLKMLANLRDKVAVVGMARNPLLATLLCINRYRFSLNLPIRRVDIYQRVLKGLLGEWNSVNEYEKVDRELLMAKLRLLEEMAWHFFPLEILNHERLYDFLWDEKNGYMQKIPRGHPLLQIKNTIIHELCQDGILVPVGGVEAPEFIFLHLTFQEYLVASALARRANDQGWQSIASLVDKKAWLPNWQEVIILLAGQLKNPTPQLELLVDKGKDDAFRHRLALAGLCLPELLKSHRDQQATVVDKITTNIFSLCWGHELRDTSNAIPHLVNALPALIQVNGQVRLPSTDDKIAPSNKGLKSWVQKFYVKTINQKITIYYDKLPIRDILTSRLCDEDTNVQRSAARIMNKLGREIATPSSEAKAILTDLLYNKESKKTFNTSNLLANLQDNKSAWVRYSTIKEIEKLGVLAATPAIVEQLAKLVHYEESGLRAPTMKEVGKATALAAVTGLALLSSRNPRRRYPPVRYPRRPPASARPSKIDRILEDLQWPSWFGDKDQKIRSAAASALSTIMRSGVRLFEKDQGFEVKWVRELAGIDVGAEK